MNPINEFINYEDIIEIIEEIFEEKHLSPMLKKASFVPYVKEGIQDIDETIGRQINYTEDYKARSLLKNYVLYTSKNLLHVFKDDYANEYIELQFKYNSDSYL